MDPEPILEAQVLGAPLRRPGLLTAVAVFDLVLAVLAIRMNLFLYPGARQMLDWTAPPTPVGRPTPDTRLTPYAGDATGPHGLDRAARARVVELVGSKTPLSADRREMLDRFLADVGQDAFPSVAIGGRPGADLRGGLTTRPDRRQAVDADVFATAGGTIRIENRRASLTGGARAAEMQVNAFREDDGTWRWSAASIGEALQAARERVPEMTTLHAAATLQVLLATPTQPGAKWTPPELPTAHVLPGGTFEFDIDKRAIWVMADGRVVEPRDGFDPTTGELKAEYAGASGMRLPISRGAVAVLFADAFVSVALALLLLGCGAAALADARSAGRYHLAWAGLKVAWVAIVAGASAVVLSQWPAAIMVARGRSLNLPDTAALTAKTWTGVVVWLIWPAALLIIMGCAPTVRWYLAARRAEASFASAKRSRGAGWAWLVLGFAGALAAALHAVVAADAGAMTGAQWAGVAVGLAVAAMGVASWAVRPGTPRTLPAVAAAARALMVLVGLALLARGTVCMAADPPKDKRPAPPPSRTAASDPGQSQIEERQEQQMLARMPNARQAARFAQSLADRPTWRARLLRLLASPDASRRRDAILILGEPEPTLADKDNALLTTHLRDNPDGPAAVAAALPALFEALVADDAELSRAAYRALRGPIGMSDDFAPFLTNALRAPRPEARGWALELSAALKPMTPAMREAAVAVLEGDAQLDLAQAAAQLLDGAGPEGRAAVERARREGAQRARLAVSLARREPLTARNDGPALSAAAEMVREAATAKSRAKLPAAIDLLRTAAAPATDVAPVVVALLIELGDDDSAREKLAQAFPTSAQTTPALAPLLRDPRPPVRRTGIALVGFRSSFDESYALLVEAMGDADPGVARPAAQALERRGDWGRATDRQLWLVLATGRAQEAPNDGVELPAWQMPARVDEVAEPPASATGSLRAVLDPATIALAMILPAMLVVGVTRRSAGPPGAAARSRN